MMIFQYHVNHQIVHMSDEPVTADSLLSAFGINVQLLGYDPELYIDAMSAESCYDSWFIGSGEGNGEWPWPKDVYSLGVTRLDITKY